MTIKILIIDDDPALLELTREMLEDISEYEVYEAADATLARGILLEQEIDLVLCDVELPGESGIDLTKFITETYENIIVIMISGHDNLYASEKAIENGAFSYLVKPVSRSQLKISVSNACQFRNHKELVREQRDALFKKISDLIKAKQDLAESEEEFRSIFENMQEGFYRASPDGKLIMANPMTVHIMGYDSFEEIRGVEMTRFYLNPEDRGVFLQKIEKQGGVSAHEINIKKKDGSIATILANSHHRKDKNGTLLGIEGTILDITEQKRLEMELFQAQKIESIGRLAAGIAHEINTPIQFVGDNIQFIRDVFKDLNAVAGQFQDFLVLAKKGMADPESVRKLESALKQADIEFLTTELPAAITQSLEGIDRVRKIVTSMKEFSHSGGDDHVITDINRAIENTVTVAKNEWKYVADLETDLDAGLPEIFCNPGEINQVLLNMMINASHAISDAIKDKPGEKGKIIIQTRNRAGFIDILISDTGAGIPDAIKDKIFEPFFTTKTIGKGTGQGLAISRSIIMDRHKGRITLESQPGKGTTFIISLPKERETGKES